MRGRRLERGEILTFAVTAQNDDELAVRPKPLQGGDRCADIGALAIVEIFDVAYDADRLHAVRLATVLTQSVQHGCQRATRCRCQRQRSKRVNGVVSATNAQCLGRYQTLDVQVFGLLPFANFVSRVAFHGAH